jgi:threonine/homoserine/homoserine lactone efflux protein
MPTIETIFAVTLAGLALSASPGPSMLYVLSRSIGQSRNAGFMSAAGLATGGLVLALATAMGLAALFTTSPVAYAIVQYGGAAYLFYLGVDMICSRDETTSEVQEIRRTSLWRVFYQGVVVEVLNPKTILFFIAFIPQFVDAELGSLPAQMLVLGILVPLTAIPSDLIVASTGGTLATQITRNQLIHQALKWAAGLFLIALGGRVLID